MDLSDFYSEHIISLNANDTADSALDIMQDMEYKHLPVVDEHNHFIGIVFIDTLLEGNYTSTNTVQQLVIPIADLYCKNDVSMLDIIHFLKTNRITIAPIVNENLEYLGSVDYENIIDYFSDLDFIKTQGVVIELEKNQYQFSMTELSKIIESEGAKILFFQISSNLQENIQFEIKISNGNLSGILSSLERYNYTIIHCYQEINKIDIYKDRYDSLMKYLSI